MQQDNYHLRVQQLAQQARPHFPVTHFSPTPGPVQSPTNNTSVLLLSSDSKSGSSSRSVSILNSNSISKQELVKKSSNEQSPINKSIITPQTDRSLPPPTQKMSCKGPVAQEYTAAGTTPSGKPRLFVCTICTRAFARQEHLNRHERSHTKEKPFACNICSRKFSRRDLLLRHSTKLHAGASDVIPRIRKKSAKYSKNNGENNEPITSLTANSNSNTMHSSSLKNDANSINTDITSVDEFKDALSTFTGASSPFLNNDQNRMKRSRSDNVELNHGQVKKASKRKGSIKTNSQGLQLSILPEIKENDSIISSNIKIESPQNTQQQKQSSSNELYNFDLDNNMLDTLEFGASLRRASFSAMSGPNYALGGDGEYASETVEFSTPQFYSIDDENFKVENENADNDYNNNFNDNNNNMANKKSTDHQSAVNNWLSNYNNEHNDALSNSLIDGYSFYQNEEDTLGITENLGNAHLNDQSMTFQDGLATKRLPFANNISIPKENFIQGSKVDEMNLSSLEQMLYTKFPHPIERARKLKDSITEESTFSENTNNLESIPLSELPAISPIIQKDILSSTSNGLDRWRDMGVRGLLSGLWSGLQDSISNFSPSQDSNELRGTEAIAAEGVSRGVTDNRLINHRIIEKINSDNNIVDDDLNHKVRTWQETLFNQPIGNLERLNDLHVSNMYGVPQGYSFYGDSIDLPLSSDIDVDATISPELLNTPSPPPLTDFDRNNNDTQKNQLGLENVEIHLNKRHHQLSFEDEFSNVSFESLSHIFLFTSNSRRRLDAALAEYPYMGVPTPSIPANEILNLYVDQFINKFLTHHPFVHKAGLNEYSMIKNYVDEILKDSVSVEEFERIKKGDCNNISPGIKIVRDEIFDTNFKVSLACLPLLITTIGAVVSNKKSDAASLYEASRRCIHVYLETRKKFTTVVVGNSLNQNETDSIIKSPLWLIQSLTLSVIYGLFADDEISLSIIIRQVHALNTLLKSSGLTTISADSTCDSNFLMFVKYESIIRTIHMCFHVSTLLSTLYNIVPSLTVADLCINLPCSSILWECGSAEDYMKLVESFNFQAKNFKFVLGELASLDFTEVDMDSEGDENIWHNFLFEYHVSELGLICLQNGLHQLSYFHYMGKNESDIGIGLVDNNSNSLVNVNNLRNVGKNWNEMVNSCKLYNEYSEVFNDSRIMNHFLNLKLCSIVSLNKIKESVWLKSFADINEKYYACFNYGDDEMNDGKFQTELIEMVENSINILKLVFFNEDSSLIGSISQSYEVANETLEKLDSLYRTPTPTSPQRSKMGSPTESIKNKKVNLSKINLNILHKVSIDSQILFDVILIIVKFLTNYENIYKIRLKFTNLSAFTFLDDRNQPNHNEKFDEILFKYYLKFFRIFLSLEQFMKLNYNYEDFETEQPLEGNPFYPVQTLKARGLISSTTGSEINRILSGVASNELKILSDRDLIMNELIGFRLPYKFLKMGGFLFGFIYDRNFKFVNFKNLSDVLFHLRVFLEGKDEDV